MGYFDMNAAVEVFDKIIMRDDGSQAVGNMFYIATELREVRFEGVIGQNGFDVHWSTKLSEASIRSIINALSTTTTGLTVTLSETAVHSIWPPPSMAMWAQWEALIATRPNWTISLV